VAVLGTASLYRKEKEDCIDFYTRACKIHNKYWCVASGPYVPFSNKFSLNKNKIVAVSPFHLSAEWSTGVRPNCTLPLGNVKLYQVCSY
jgi:hypothetical protein